MADERIDIEITDKVDGNIEKKVLGIAEASEKGWSAVQKLKAALKDINTTAVSKLAAASASATNALAREMSASAKMTIARTKEAEAASRMALAAQKLATEQERTATATLKAQAAADRAAAAKDKEANASKRLTAELEREASAAKRVIHDPVTIQPSGRDRLSGSDFNTGPGRSTAAEQVNSMRRSSAPIVDAAGTKGMNDASQAADKLNASLGKAGAGAGLARHNMVNLGYQLQDIVVSLQAGQAPLTVFIQQGSQIAGIAAAAGVGIGGMARAVWTLLAPFAPLVIALGALYLGFKQFTAESAARNKPELEKYANSLGLTSKEMRKLGNDSVDASGKLKSFNNVGITSGDSWNGFIATVKEGLTALIEPFKSTGNIFKQVWELAIAGAVAVFRAFYGVVVGGMKATAAIILNLPSVIKNSVIGMVNAVIQGVETMINLAGTGINTLIDATAPLLDRVGVKLQHVGKVSFGQFAKSGKSAFEVIADSVNNEMGNFDKIMDGFSKRWDANNVKAAKARMKGVADAIIKNRNPKVDKPDKPKVDHTAENRAHALDIVNLKLDDELKRMQMLKPEREIQQRYDQIEADLAQKKIKLNDAEKLSIMGKITAIEKYKFVQAESDRIYENAVAPLRTYNATVDAAKQLLASGAITQQQMNEAVNLGAKAYRDATDPLASMKDTMTQSTSAAGLYGQAVERNTYLEQIRQQLLQKGIDLQTNATASQRAEVQALVDKNNALLQQQFIQSQVGAIVNPMLEQQQTIDAKTQMYAEIDRLEAQAVITHQQHEQAKYALDAKFSQLRLQNASNTFGQLAQLSSSGNSKLAAIGKAAAITQATIDGFVAVQKALASGPPPWNFVQAAAVGVTTAIQVAGIINTPTNVGSFATGGQFMVDGRAGVDNNNIAMNVSRGERVTIETAEQQRQADAGGAPVVQANTKIINQFDEQSFVGAMDSDEGERIILNVIKRNPAAINGTLR